LKFAVALVAMLLWQAGDFATAGKDAATVGDPQHMQYERALTLPQGVTGVACAVLDAGVFAHVQSRSADDLRVFGGGAETPFVLSESAAQPVDVVAAQVENLGMRGGNVVFDLVMPDRVYSEVDLQIEAKDFVATAKVSGSDGRGGKRTDLGSFALFDLSAQNLSRSTSLPLQEVSFARLHVELHVTTPAGRAYAEVSPAMVVGATVPASREAQTLYTVVASAQPEQSGQDTIARIDMPALVPVERVSFVLEPRFKADFLREVSIDTGQGQTLESLPGEIERVTRPGLAGEPEIRNARLSVDAVMASNLRVPSRYLITVKNGNDVPLPLKAVELEMRQRTVCFAAKAGVSYVLRYGDPGLHAPVYDFARLYTGEAKPIVAMLGPEEENVAFRERADARPYTERHPEVLWIGLVIVVAALGATAMHSVKQQGRKT
jgi:hypothetical protein